MHRARPAVTAVVVAAPVTGALAACGLRDGPSVRWGPADDDEDPGGFGAIATTPGTVRGQDLVVAYRIGKRRGEVVVPMTVRLCPGQCPDED